jgi:hypothetical protein
MASGTITTTLRTAVKNPILKYMIEQTMRAALYTDARWPASSSIAPAQQ